MSASEKNTVKEPEQFRKLFVGRLNFKTTNYSLKKFFEKWGDVDEAIVMKYPKKQSSRGFGFVTFSKASMVDDVMANRPHTIDGREVDTKRAIPHDDMLKPDITCTVKKMLVSGIKELTEEELREYFGQYGKILNIKIVTDKETGQCKGYGFIEFDDSDSVDKAVYLIKNHEVSGKKLEVKKAVSNDEASYSREQRGGCGAGSGRGQNWDRPNNVGKGYNFGRGYRGGSSNDWVQDTPQGWNNLWGSKANLRRGNEGDNQSGHGGGPICQKSGNNRAVPYHTGRGSGYFHQNARGQY